MITAGDVSAQSVAQEVYFQLLNPPCAEKWKEAAVKFGAAWSVVHPQVHYDELSYRERALILKVSDAAMCACVCVCVCACV